MDHSIEVKSLAELDAAAKKFLDLVEGHSLIAFRAPMGAGKTTFTSAICRCLGVDGDAVSSPTFAIVNEYRAADGKPVFHFDFYRINRLYEALDLGLYEYLDSGCLCLMEWPENIEGLLPEQTLVVDISVRDDGARLIRWQD